MEIRTLPTISHDSERLAELHGDWRDLQDAIARVPGSRAWDDAMRDLYARIHDHRGALLAVNAELQSAVAVIDDALALKIEGNIDAIKFCTVMLGELSAALGTISRPAPTR